MPANSMLSASGAVTSMLAGALLGSGFGLLQNDQRWEDVARRTVGGSLFVAGLYLFAPAAMRRAWIDN